MPTHRAHRRRPLFPRCHSVAALLGLIVLVAMLSGCGDAKAPPEVAESLAAATAESALPAPSTTPSVTDTVAVAPSATLTPTASPTASTEPSLTPTPAASATPTLPTATPTATGTATAEPAPTPTLPVYDAAYVADVTVPDGTVIEPGTPFTKTWRLRNTGNTPWDETTSLALAVGEAMGAPEAVPVPATAPGETADVSVPMVAPAVIGEHSAAWRLCRAEGCFGGAVTLQIVSRSALAVRGPAVELPPAEPAACNYIGNRNPTSMKFHRADCRWVQEMYEGNKVCFATREEAVAAGYVPCKVCKP